MEITGQRNTRESSNRIYLINYTSDLSVSDLNDTQKRYVKDLVDSKKELTSFQRLICFNQFNSWIGVLLPDKVKKEETLVESFRLDGVQLQDWANKQKLEDLSLIDLTDQEERLYATAEGLILSNYQFLAYFSESEKKSNSLQSIQLSPMGDILLSELKLITESVSRARDLINEPLSSLTAPKLADEIVKMAQKVAIEVEVFDKARIESLKMGGLIAVNRGSIDPPRFCVMKYLPEKAVNEKPLILVGKGIVFDTGGLSLKPTPNSMDLMKSDMAGAAAVIGAMYAIAALNWPVNVIGLIPATDNRPDGNAYVPGDIIQMHNGLNVEVLNTDAEGRMILADALSYAKRFDPELVIDLATLTGAAAVAIGTIGTVVMGTADDQVFQVLDQAGKSSYERVVRFPLWEEYAPLLESTCADLKNIGGRDAGAITAGKFLERFTDYPWIHMDIAGPSFMTTIDTYRGIGGSGTGVRLLLEFVRNHFLSTTNV